LNLHDKEKIKYLLETQGKKLEYDALEEKRSPLFEQRKDIHRTYLAKKEEVEQTDATEFETEIEDHSEKLAELHTKLQQAEDHNKSFYDMESRLER
jgi:flagellar biosynthesis/type III secretory pathway chaperone